MSKPTAEVRNRYKLKAYDRIEILVKKGEKERIKAISAQQGISVNALITAALYRYLDELLSQQ